MTDERFAQIMSLSHELSGVEFKGPGALNDSRLVAQAVKAVLGMANRRDGGVVVIGLKEEANSFDPVGLSDDELPSWTYDAVAEQIARYADPSVAFQLEIKQYDNKSFIVLEVYEFSDIPVLCKRSYNNILRDEGCYVRTRKKPETSELPTQTEMRELLDLAIEKGVKQFLERAERVGLYISQTSASVATDQERFDEQLGELK